MCQDCDPAGGACLVCSPVDTESRRSARRRVKRERRERGAVAGCIAVGILVAGFGGALRGMGHVRWLPVIGYLILMTGVFLWAKPWKEL